MRPEHVAANRLIDIALTGDREAYRDELGRIRREASPVAYDDITRLASMQYRMQTQDSRYMAWRTDWVKDQKSRAMFNEMRG